MDIGILSEKYPYLDVSLEKTTFNDDVYHYDPMVKNWALCKKDMEIPTYNLKDFEGELEGLIRASAVQDWDVHLIYLNRGLEVSIVRHKNAKVKDEFFIDLDDSKPNTDELDFNYYDFGPEEDIRNILK